MDDSRLAELRTTELALREALSLRWGLALQYWSTLGTFGESRWPVEDIPWETTDGRNSAYFTELVLGIIAGLILLFWPAISILTLAVLAGIWLIVQGIAQISLAMQLRRV